jgi:hypothetical protein
MSPPASASIAPSDGVMADLSTEARASSCPDTPSPPVPDAASVSRTASGEAVAGERTWPLRWIAGCGSACEWLFGLLSLVLGLAVLASLPVLQLLSLGYLLEASGRVTRRGRLRDGLVGVRKAARIGSLVAGTWLMLLPLRLASDYWYSSYLIDAGSEITQGWRVGMLILTGLMVIHILTAWYCGGRLRHFFWPLLAPFSLPLWLLRALLARTAIGSPGPSFLSRLASDLLRVRPLREWFVPAVVWDGSRQGRMWSRCRDAVWDFVASLRLPYYFSLGLRGFIGAMTWLVVPVILLIGATTLPRGIGVLSGLIGALLLLLVVLYLPFLQANFAAENRLGAMFQLGHVRRSFQRAPVALLAALLATLLFALPLYLLMVEMTPREVVFLPSLLFVAFIWPARLLAGWALGRARRRERPRHFLLRWSARLATVPAAGFYVLIVFFTRYTSWHGVWGLFEQHAFLIPGPFLSL